MDSRGLVNTFKSVIRSVDIDDKQRDALDRYRNWKRFHRGPRQSGQPLLVRLPRYPDCVLVAGCQRSGTTMLTRVIAASAGFQRFALTHDDELDAALILAGHVDMPDARRYCFQTTYLNECFPEYSTIGPRQRLIWVLRNPYSVVYSMLKNWRRFALNELYASVRSVAPNTSNKSNLPWPFDGCSRAEKACVAYSGKTTQIIAIQAMLDRAQLLIVEYDQLVQRPAHWFPTIFRFIDEPFDPTYISGVQSASVGKADHMSERLKRSIDALAMPAYRKCLPLVTPLNPL